MSLTPGSVLLAATAALLALAAPAAASSSPTQTKTTTSYVFELSLGKAEKMWTQAQVRAQHPTSGEVMLAGSMSDSMSMGGLSRHLEVKILSRASHKVVTNAHPTIKLVDQSAMDKMAMTLSFAKMRGVDEGADDVHYGNNVDLVAKHRYQVTVTLKGERAIFRVTAPSA